MFREPPPSTPTQVLTWTPEGSVFRDRVRQCESRDFFNTSVRACAAVPLCRLEMWRRVASVRGAGALGVAFVTPTGAWASIVTCYG